jgi:hypothetical protein
MFKDKNNHIPDLIRDKKAHYKVKNWSEYNHSLKQRGEITFWFSESAIKEWIYKGPHKQGAPKRYSDLAIETILTIRSLFSLPLRNTQGFIQSLVKQMQLNIPVPDYTTICRREKSIKVCSFKNISNHEPLHVLIDSTGLKVFGEGEWKVRRHGYTKHRMWRKLHLVVDLDSGNIMAQAITTNSVTDADAAVHILTSPQDSIDTLIGDTGYDYFKIYDLCQQKGISPIIKPKKNARIRLSDKTVNAWASRNKHLTTIQNKGLPYWKKHSGYSKRSLAETTMFRYKTTFGDKPLAHSLENQKIESTINCNILNKFYTLGKPNSYLVFY